MPLRRLGSTLGLAGLGFVLLATLTPVSDPRHLAQLTALTCLVCGDRGGADVAVNLLLFVPLATGLVLRGTPWRRTVFLCFLLSVTVESLQFFLVPGRDASLSDVITNTSGAALGTAVASALPGWLVPPASRARGLVVRGLVVVLGLLSLWGWLLAPGVPRGRLMSRWAHQAPGRDVFDGRVIAVRLNGSAMPADGPPPNSAELRRRLDGGTFEIETEIVSGLPVRDRLWIYMLRVPSGGALTLNQRRLQAGVEVPTRGLRYKLHPTLITLPDAFPDSAGVPVSLAATESAHRVHLSSQHSGRVHAVTLALSPAFGWVQFVPVQLASGTDVRWVTAAVLFILFFPPGYWGSRCRPRSHGGGLLALGLSLALAVLPAALGFPAVHWSEWLASAAGAITGWGTASLVSGMLLTATPEDATTA